MRGIASLAFSVACVVSYHVVASHYYQQCHASWFSFLHTSSLYCRVVERGVRALQVAPLLALAPHLFAGERRPAALAW